MKLYKRFPFLILITIFISGCGPLPPSTTLRTPSQPAFTEEAFSQPTASPAPTENTLTRTTATPVPTEVFSATPVQGDNPWVEYRDPRYRYAIALPCYWTYTPTPMEGMFAAMVARSYNEEFFAAHSERGNWKNDIWPEGALKMDVYVFEGVDPALNLADAVHQFYADYSTEQELTSLEEVTFGSHPALLITVTGGLSGGTVNRLVYFRLAPDKLLWFIFYPDTAMDSPDAQAIMNSLMFSSEAKLIFPSINPSGRPDDGSLSCS
jgi:hypothetical protein